MGGCSVRTQDGMRGAETCELLLLWYFWLQDGFPRDGAESVQPCPTGKLQEQVQSSCSTTFYNDPVKSKAGVPRPRWVVPISMLGSSCKCCNSHAARNSGGAQRGPQPPLLSSPPFWTIRPPQRAAQRRERCDCISCCSDQTTHGPLTEAVLLSQTTEPRKANLSGHWTFLASESLPALPSQLHAQRFLPLLCCSALTLRPQHFSLPSRSTLNPSDLLPFRLPRLALCCSPPLRLAGRVRCHDPLFPLLLDLPAHHPSLGTRPTPTIEIPLVCLHQLSKPHHDEEEDVDS